LGFISQKYHMGLLLVAEYGLCQFACRAILDTRQQVRIDFQGRHINTNRSRMIYKTYQERARTRLSHRQGVVESGCKQIIQARHKQAGMRWNRDNAQKMLNLAVFICSDRWQEFWGKQGAA